MIEKDCALIYFMIFTYGYWDYHHKKIFTIVVLFFHRCMFDLFKILGEIFYGFQHSCAWQGSSKKTDT